MMKRFIFIAAVFIILIISSASKGSENDLPLSDNIKILKVTPYGEETKDIFEIRTDDFSYENFFRLIQERIREGYKPDCNCEFDNDYLLSLNKRSLLETEQISPARVNFIRETQSDRNSEFDEWFYCKINLSENMKYVGLQFIRFRGEWTIEAQHFILMNSKGDKLWEIPHGQVKMHTSTGQIEFPSYEPSNVHDRFRVSNIGKVLRLTAMAVLQDNSLVGWRLYDETGKLITSHSLNCNNPAFSGEGRHFLIFENTDKDDNWSNDVFATSFYDEKGNLLWQKNNIVPLPDVDYISSTTGKYFLAGFKIGEGVITQSQIDWCIIDKNGNLVSRRNYPQKWLDARNRIHGMYLTDEPRLYWGGGYINTDFTPGFYCRTITKSQDIRDNFGRLVCLKMLPLTENYFIAAGFMGSDSKMNFDPDGAHKFFAIIDRESTLKGLKIINTGLTNNRTFRLKVDKKTLEFYLYTNDVSIKAQFDLEKGQSK